MTFFDKPQVRELIGVGSRRMSRGNARVAAIAVAGFLVNSIATPVAAQVVDIPFIGAYDQGAPFRLQCPAGEYMVGAEGRRGAWIDAIAPRCAPWDRANQQFAAARPLAAVGGAGGEQAIAYCPNAPLIKSMSVTTTRTAPAYVDFLLFHCRDKSNTALEQAYFNGDGEGTYSRDRLSECPNDYVAIGLHGRAGDYLDAVGLICAPLPPDKNALAVPGSIKSLSRTKPQTDLPDSLERSAPPRILSIGGKGEKPPAPAPHRVRFDAPTIEADDGVAERLDYCLNFADQCGLPAASAYCAIANPQTPIAVDAPLQYGVGRSFTIGDRQLCEAENCSSFSYVICGSP